MFWVIGDERDDEHDGKRDGDEHGEFSTTRA